MPRKLGEALVRSGRISESQLQRAVTDQLVFGGHLGTSLLELAYIDERGLGEALAAIHEVPYADHRALSNVPYEVTRAFPAKLAEKHKVVPLRQSGKNLHLAMVDPTNILALDEISFVTGFKIVPSVALEVRVLEALERYYNLPRSQRFIMLAEEMSRREGQAAGPGDAGATREGAAAGARATATCQTAQEARMQALGAAGQADQFAGEEYGYGRSWREIAESMDPDDGASAGMPDGAREQADTRPQPRATVPPPAANESVRMYGAAVRRLALAEDVGEIFATVLDYAANRLPHCMVFVTRNHHAILWAAQGSDLRRDGTAKDRFPLEDSIFSLVDPDDVHYLGAIPRRRGILDFYEEIGVGVPKTVLLIPIRVKGRVAAYLYADGGQQEILAIDLPSLQALCARAGFALQILILRKKILAV